MSHRPGPRNVRRWPRWAVIPLGLSLTGLVILLGMLLESAGHALRPVQVESTPTMPAVGYGRSVSEACQNCHFSLEALQTSAADVAHAEAYLIEPLSIHTVHGSLGCVACHQGEGEAEDKETAHSGLIRDISRSQPEQCVICHRDLPEQIPGDELLTPHQIVESKIQHGEQGDLFCSDCHGGVGHGFDPVSGEVTCSMMVCVRCHADEGECAACHQSSETGVQMTGCTVCHEGPHDVADRLTCPCCHTSFETWREIETSIHPVELPGAHGETQCFECHEWPNFEGLHYVCADCHESGHADWGGYDCVECHDPAATWNAVASTWDRHIEYWDMYKGDHREVECQGCHFETYTELDSSCDACHSLPDTHDANSTQCWLCH
jgi:hypothetical protein